MYYKNISTKIPNALQNWGALSLSHKLSLVTGIPYSIDRFPIKSIQN